MQEYLKAITTDGKYLTETASTIEQAIPLAEQGYIQVAEFAMLKSLKNTIKDTSLVYYYVHKTDSERRSFILDIELHSGKLRGILCAVLSSFYN